MRRPSKLFFAVAAVGGCLVVVLCLVTVVFGVSVARTQNFSFALPVPAATRATNKIVVVDNLRNIVIIDPRTKAVTALTKDADGGATREYDSPTWSPDSKYIAFTSFSAQNDRPSAAVFDIRADGTQTTTLFQTESDIPVYLYWSPNSQHMSFLTQKGESLALQLAQPDQQNSAQQLETGSPLYWAWSPDSQTLLLHIGGAPGDSQEARVSLRQWTSNASAKKLNLDPASFQSPQWSADGKQVLFAASETARPDALKSADARGENVKTVVNYTGRIAFSASPRTNQIAYVVTPDNIPIPTFGHLRLINADGSQDRELTNEDVLAFFWSPDAKSIAYLVATDTPNNSSNGSGLARPRAQQNAELYFKWIVLDLASGKAHSAATFIPTEKFLALLPFFDQYARSISFWSPDSQFLVYSAGDPNDNTSGTVWTVNVKQGSTSEKIGDGVAAFWSWH